MADFQLQCLLMFIFCSLRQGVAQDFTPTNLNATYVANGSIQVTWGPPVNDASITNYYVEVNIPGSGTNPLTYKYAKTSSYHLAATVPDTVYTFTVKVVRGGSVQRGPAYTSLTTPKALIRENGAATRMTLPKLPDGRANIVRKNKDDVSELFVFISGRLISPEEPLDDITVNMTPSATELTFDPLKLEYAGYYYVMAVGNDIIIGGELLIVTETPDKPIIPALVSSPAVDESTTLNCEAMSRSKPDNHGLTMTSSWKVNDSDVNIQRFSVEGISLVIDPVRYQDKYNVYTCAVREGTSRSSKESDGFKFNPRYGPQFLTIDGAPGLSPAVLGDVYGPVVCRTDCNPPCTMEWERSGAKIAVATANDIELRDKLRSRVALIHYSCIASSVNTRLKPGRFVKNLTVEIYFPPKINVLQYSASGSAKADVGNDVTVQEGSSLVISVGVDSNPASEVTIARDGTLRSVDVFNTAKGTYDVRTTGLQCNNSGTYVVKATNFVTTNRTKTPEQRSYNLQVKCTPRRKDGMNTVIEMAGKRASSVTLSVEVIANPKPEQQWSDGVTSPSVDKVNGYTYTILGEVHITLNSDFRMYHVNISHAGLSVLMVNFRIRPEDVPETPINFQSPKIGHNYVTVTWVSGFNGGNEQYFHIECSTPGQQLIKASNISDDGLGSLMTYEVSGLTPSTDYVIRLNVSNQIGDGNSSEITVRTLETPREPQPTTSSAVYVIVIVAVVVIVIIAVIVFMIKRRQNGQPRGVAKKQFVVVHDNNDNANGHEIIYENSAAVSAQGPGSSRVTDRAAVPSRTVNPDGLIYVDVEFKTPPRTGGKGVIHGADDRTAYSFVDFSKTAPPLPPEDGQKATE